LPSFSLHRSDAGCDGAAAVEATTPLGYAQANQESCFKTSKTFRKTQPTPELKVQILLPARHTQQVQVVEGQKPSAKAKPAKAVKVSKAKPARAAKTDKAKKSAVVGKAEAKDLNAHGKNGSTNGVHAPIPDAIKPVAGGAISVIDQPDVQDKLRELVRLAKEQGYLTYDDVNEALPENMSDPDEMEDDHEPSPPDGDRDRRCFRRGSGEGRKEGRRTRRGEEKVETNKLDILDDPVRMYLKQMGQVPLLTREQEVEISKRIEDAELQVQAYINRFGFIPRAYLDIAQKLIEGRERFDRVILDKKIESRDRYMKTLPKLMKTLEDASAKVSSTFKSYIAHGGKSHDTKSYHEFEKTHKAIQKLYPKFFFKQKVTEEFVAMADEHHRIVRLHIVELDKRAPPSRRKPRGKLI
jgi:RNA polymerase primary sigma factor